MAKLSKALVPISPRSLVPVKTIDAKAIVLAPEKGLAVRPVADGGQLTIPKKGGSTVVVSQSGTETAEERRRRIGSGEIEAMNTAGQLKGLVKASDALLVAGKFGLPIGQVMEALRPLVLTMGNKRKYEILADGTRIHRRLGGTGYDGKNNAGQFTKGGSKTKQASGSAGGGMSDDPFSYVTKKRSNVGGQTTPDVPSAPPLVGVPTPKALPGKTAPLQLGDAPKTARPGRSAAASGFVTTEQRAGGIVGPDTDAVAGSSPLAATIDTVVRYVNKAKRTSKTPTKVIDTAIGLRLDDAKRALKAKDFTKAVKLFFSDSADWFDAAEQLEAQKLIEKSMR